MFDAEITAGDGFNFTYEIKPSKDDVEIFMRNATRIAEEMGVDFDTVYATWMIENLEMVEQAILRTHQQILSDLGENHNGYSRKLHGV